MRTKKRLSACVAAIVFLVSALVPLGALAAAAEPAVPTREEPVVAKATAPDGSENPITFEWAEPIEAGEAFGYAVGFPITSSVTGTAAKKTSVADLQEWLDFLPDTTIEVYTDFTCKNLADPESPVASGMDLFAKDPESGATIGENMFVVPGDCLGTGVMNIAQVTCVAQVVSKQRGLYGPQKYAVNFDADFTGIGQIDLSDLMHEVRLFQQCMER